MSDLTAMEKLPQEKIYQTIRSMQDELEDTFMKCAKLRDETEENRGEYLLALLHLRTLSDEIIRWEML